VLQLHPAGAEPHQGLVELPVQGSGPQLGTQPSGGEGDGVDGHDAVGDHVHGAAHDDGCTLEGGRGSMEGGGVDGVRLGETAGGQRAMGSGRSALKSGRRAVGGQRGNKRGVGNGTHAC
jgi:hypothetical protein